MDLIKEKTLEWLAAGRVGMSSKTMALHICGIKTEYAHPHDPADFNRCLLFLDAVPEARQHIGKMAELSKTWAALIDNWSYLEDLFMQEVGVNWSKARSAPETFRAMRDIIDAAQGLK